MAVMCNAINMNTFSQRLGRTKNYNVQIAKMSGLISIEMFMALEEEVHDLKEQNKILKAENNRLRNQLLQSSTSTRDPSGQIVSRPDSYSPYRPGTTSQPRQMPMRITKAILESILHNPKQFTQINTDQPQHLCTFLKVKLQSLSSARDP